MGDLSLNAGRGGSPTNTAGPVERNEETAEPKDSACATATNSASAGAPSPRSSVEEARRGRAGPLALEEARRGRAGPLAQHRLASVPQSAWRWPP